MSTIDEILATIEAADATEAIDELLVIDPNTRQINIPSAELTFGVEADTHSERKYFQCARYVGDNLDLASCFIRVNYRNANGEIDADLVDDVRIVGDNILFSWELSRKVTMYEGQVHFVVCACRTGAKPVEWHTAQATGIVLMGLEPNGAAIEAETADVISQLIALVENQGESVRETGETERASVVAAAEAEKTAMVNEIEAKGTNTLASIPDDYTAVSEAVTAIERGMAPGIVCEVEGNTVAVSDASDRPVQSLRVFGRSTQDGVPSPDAPVEIESVVNPTATVCGKNLLPNAATNESFNGITIVVNGDKSITVNGTATGNVFYAPYGFTFKAGQSYVLSGCPKNGSADTYFMYINNLGGVRDYGNGVVVNLDEDFTSDVGFSIRSGTTVNNLTFYPMVKVGTVTDEYEPRKPSQTVEITHTLHGIPVSSGGNYTDSNGQQWICDEVDLERGVYVQRVRNLVFNGTEEIDNTWYPVAIYHIHSPAPHVNLTHNSVRCSHFGSVSCGNTLGTSVAFGNLDKLGFASSGDLTAFFAEQYAQNNPVTIQYAIATPIETPLSETELAAYRALHTNKPNTTVLNDAGAWMNVEYVADTKLYIDNKIAAIVSGT